MLETMTAFVMAEHMGGLTFEPPLGPPGYARMLAPDRRPHRTADGHICILPYTDRHWRDFFRIAGRPDLAEDPRLADAETRSRHVAELYALIAQCVSDRPTAYWLQNSRPPTSRAVRSTRLPICRPTRNSPPSISFRWPNILRKDRSAWCGRRCGLATPTARSASGAAARQHSRAILREAGFGGDRDRRSPRSPDRDRGCPGLVGPGDDQVGMRSTCAFSPPMLAARSSAVNNPARSFGDRGSMTAAISNAAQPR